MAYGNIGREPLALIGEEIVEEAVYTCTVEGVQG